MSEKKNKTVDLTEGTVFDAIIAFIVPLILASVFQQFYSLTNQLIVGNYVSTNALSAVSACTVITNVFTWFFSGLGLGAGVVTSHAFGSKDHNKLKESINTSILLSVVLGLVLTALSELALPLMMNVININETLYPIAFEYLRVYLLGSAAVLTYNMSFNILRSLGDSKHPLYYLIFSSIINIVLGMIFVRVLHMNVVGTALASIISQFVVDILCFRLMAENPMIDMRMRELRINWSIAGEICRLGIPAGIQNMLIAMASVTVQSYVNLFPNEAIAGVGVAERVTSYATLPLHALTSVSTSFIGQNYGARKYERVREGVKILLRLSNIIAICTSTLVFIFARPLVAMFNQNEEVIAYGVQMVRWTVYSTIFIGWSHIYNGTCRGCGNIRLPFVIAIFSQFAVRYAFVTISFMHSFDIRNIYITHDLGYVCAGVFATLYFRFSRWTKENQLRV
ncbi:MAG: MATE family efflux transporter [Erysipelotrichaceae bacterium]|nr:MATE family efflux transporter [Erysipelotrichaceae bacterium]